MSNMRLVRNSMYSHGKSTRDIRKKKTITVKRKDSLFGKAYSFEIRVRNCFWLLVLPTVRKDASYVAMDYWKQMRKRSGENRHARMLAVKNFLSRKLA